MLQTTFLRASVKLWFNLIWYSTWPCSGKVEIWPIDPIPCVYVWVGGGGGGGLQAKYLLTCYCICNSLEFDMQHDHVLKKLNFWPFDPIPRVWVIVWGLSAGKIFATVLSLMMWALFDEFQSRSRLNIFSVKCLSGGKRSKEWLNCKNSKIFEWDHLPWETTFSPSQRWSPTTDFTVPPQIKILNTVIP